MKKESRCLNVERRLALMEEDAKTWLNFWPLCRIQPRGINKHVARSRVHLNLPQLQYRQSTFRPHHAVQVL